MSPDVSSRLLKCASAAARLVVMLGVWQLLAQLTGGTFLLAGPIKIASYAAGNAPLLARAASATLQSAAIGFVIGNGVALALAAIAISLPRIEALVSGVALVFFCLPFVATGPILRVIFGVGDGPQIALAALATYYTTYLCLMVGLRAAPASWLDLVRSYGRGRFTELVRVRAAAAVPYFTVGLQIAAPAAFLGALVGEFTGAERGLGVLSIRAMRALDVDMTWTIACLSAGISALAFWLFGWQARRLGGTPPALLIAPRHDPVTRSTSSRFFGSLVHCVTITAVVLMLWVVLIEVFALSPFFAKRPYEVWSFLISAADAAANRTVLLEAFWQTLSLTALGYLLGLALGAGLAIAVVLNNGLASTILPVAIALRSIPIVTTAPLLVLALGRGPVGTITIVAVMIFFPTLAGCLEGMRRTPKPVLDIFDSYAARPWQRLVHAQLPAMAPAFFAAARMAIPAALLSATTAEWLATGTGMGTLMAMTASTSNYVMLWSAIVLIAATASAAYGAIQMLERKILKTFASEQLAI